MRLTVGLPFYNARTTLADSIRSVLAQTYSGFELLLVDDGSADGSLELAASFSDPRIRLLPGGENRGLSYRLNQIAAAARGQYLARMDADDLMHPDRLRRQLGYLQDHDDIDVLGSGAYIIDAATRLIGKRGHTGFDLSPASVLRNVLFIHPTVIGQTGWFRRHPYQERYVRAEDHDLWCRTLAESRFAHVPDLLLFYRESGVASVQKHAGSGRTDRRIFREYGPPTVGWATTCGMMARSWGKVQAFRALHRLGLHHLVVARRNSPLTARELQEGEAALQQLTAQEVGAA